MKIEKRKSKIAVLSFSLSIISLLLATSAIIFMYYLNNSAYDQFGDTNTGVIIGFISAIRLLIFAGLGIILSLMASIFVILQKHASKKYAYYGFFTDLQTSLFNKSCHATEPQWKPVFEK